MRTLFDLIPEPEYRRVASRKTAAGMKDFWAMIDAQLGEARSAKSADDVIRIFSEDVDGMSAGDAFFAGSGGDETLMGALYDAGWKFVDGDSIYYVMRAPDGSEITYVEGDIYKGNQMTKSSSRKTSERIYSAQLTYYYVQGWKRAEVGSVRGFIEFPYKHGTEIDEAYRAGVRDFKRGVLLDSVKKFIAEKWAEEMERNYQEEKLMGGLADSDSDPALIYGASRRKRR